jgi:hypothetical protein
MFTDGHTRLQQVTMKGEQRAAMIYEQHSNAASMMCKHASADRNDESIGTAPAAWCAADSYRRLR